jgi:hypothetical protein
MDELDRDWLVAWQGWILGTREQVYCRKGLRLRDFG